VEVPDSAIETSNARVWEQDGILFLQATGPPTTRDSMQEALDALRKVSTGQPMPTLADARRLPSPTPDVWVPLIEGFQELFAKVAVLVDPDDPPELGEYPDIFDRLLATHRVFTDESAAMEFLRAD